VKELCLSLDITYSLHNLSTTSHTTARTFLSCLCVTYKFAGTGLWHEIWECMTQLRPYGSDWFKFLEGAFTANQLPLNFQHRRRRLAFVSKLQTLYFTGK